MKIINLPPVFTAALPVLKKLEEAGFEAYFVGGCVRDLLLNRHIHDVDIATSAYPEEVKKTFDRTIDTGIQHGTVTVLWNHESYEITTFRTESGYQDYRRPDKVTFVQNLDEDLKRRDFTINALAMDTQGNVIDLFEGLVDLKLKLIKAVGVAEERFHEDALRMMRAVRFMSQLKFNLESQTEQAVADNHELLSKISVERVRDEFVKMGIGPDSRRAFDVFLKTGLSEECPELAGQSKKLSIFPTLNFGPSTEEGLWSVIIILLGLDDDQVAPFLRAWKNSNAVIHQVQSNVHWFDFLTETSPSDYDLFEMGETTLLSVIDIAHILGQPISAESLTDRYSRLPIKENDQLVVDGRWLIEQGMKPGPELGRTLMTIKRAVVEGEVANNEVDIAEFLKK